MGMLCQRESQSEEHYKNLQLKERELIIGRLGYLLKLTSGNVEYSECLHEFLRGKVQKKALASRQAACKNIQYNTIQTLLTLPKEGFSVTII